MITRISLQHQILVVSSKRLLKPIGKMQEEPEYKI